MSQKTRALLQAIASCMSLLYSLGVIRYAPQELTVVSYLTVVSGIVALMAAYVFAVCAKDNCFKDSR